jgi:hypothetical protein
MKKSLGLILLTAILSAGLVYYLKPSKTVVQTYPYDLKDGTHFSCSTLIGATFFPQSDLDNKPLKSIDGQLLTNDKTKMAIQIEDKILKMITATSVSVGQTDPAELAIVKNNDNELIAVDPETEVVINQGIGTFVLNKKSGLAVWTKSKPAFLATPLPDTQAYYLECR